MSIDSDSCALRPWPLPTPRRLDLEDFAEQRGEEAGVERAREFNVDIDVLLLIHRDVAIGASVDRRRWSKDALIERIESALESAFEEIRSERRRW